MPIDPTISLAAIPKDPTAGTVSPLATFAQFQQIQKELLGNQLAQQQLDARIRSGQIIAASPDSEAAIKGLMSDPVAAPFAGETLNYLRNADHTLTQIQGARAGQSRDALGALIKGSAGALTDPGQLGKLAEMHLSGMPQTMQETAKPLFRQFISAMTSDLPSDPEQARQLYQARLVGSLYGAGLSKEAMEAQTGSLVTRDRGGSIDSGVQLPSWAGGGDRLATSIPKTLPPQVVDVRNPDGSISQKVVGGPYGITPAPNALGGPYGITPAPNALGAGALPPPNGLPPWTLGQGPTGEAATYQTETGKRAADLQEDMSKDAAAIPEVLNRINVIEDSLKRFQAGGFAELRTSLGSALQGLKNAGVEGISQKLIDDVANGSLANSQLFSAAVKTLVTKAMAQDVAGTGRVMKSEVEAYLQQLSAAKSPEAIMSILNQMRFKLQVGQHRAENFPVFKQALAEGKPELKGLNMLDYYQHYNKNLKPSSMPVSTPGGMNLGPTNPGDAMGAPPGNYWNPTTNRFEASPIK